MSDSTDKKKEFVSRVLKELFESQASFGLFEGEFSDSCPSAVYSGKIVEIHYRHNGIKSFVLQEKGGRRLTVAPEQINHIDIGAELSTSPQSINPVEYHVIMHFNEKRKNK